MVVCSTGSNGPTISIGGGPAVTFLRIVVGLAPHALFMVAVILKNPSDTLVKVTGLEVEVEGVTIPEGEVVQVTVAPLGKPGMRYVAVVQNELSPSI